ncbi:unnamed protein product [Protopolystoma xenopodis]|uniref:Uncharacterized protein n=1 Tax=Protopolystoma xenopodis TaxID=117903 RepID=A0A3S5CLK8_9PLAT|nr:unnamed protein product [Protopolystoma xenopodis]
MGTSARLVLTPSSTSSRARKARKASKANVVVTGSNATWTPLHKLYRPASRDSG